MSYGNEVATAPLDEHGDPIEPHLRIYEKGSGSCYAVDTTRLGPRETTLLRGRWARVRLLIAQGRERELTAEEVTVTVPLQHGGWADVDLTLVSSISVLDAEWVNGRVAAQERRRERSLFGSDD